jgi:hypothetical protein
MLNTFHPPVQFSHHFSSCASSEATYIPFHLLVSRSVALPVSTRVHQCVPACAGYVDTSCCPACPPDVTLARPVLFKVPALDAHCLAGAGVTRASMLLRMPYLC